MTTDSALREILSILLIRLILANSSLDVRFLRPPGTVKQSNQSHLAFGICIIANSYSTTSRGKPRLYASANNPSCQTRDSATYSFLRSCQSPCAYTKSKPVIRAGILIYNLGSRLIHNVDSRSCSLRKA